MSFPPLIFPYNPTHFGFYGPGTLLFIVEPHGLREPQQPLSARFHNRLLRRTTCIRAHYPRRAYQYPLTCRGYRGI